MITHRCKNCLWWDNQHISVRHIAQEILGWKPNPGFCRKKIPNVILINKNHIGVQPVMDAEEFCGNFKEDK